jgi:prepilin-type N-terminal cleavage/methylation domain-containing protein
MQTWAIERRKGAGFSLLEALTVLLIIGILTSFAFLVYGSYRRAVRAKTTAQQIVALLGTARTLAINQNGHTQAVLDLTNSGLWIDQIDANGQVLVPKLTTPESWSSYVRVAGVDVNGTPYQNGLVRIQFHPNGTSDAARIILFSDSGDSRSTGDYLTVKLYSATARSRTFTGARP